MGEVFDIFAKLTFENKQNFNLELAVEKKTYDDIKQKSYKFEAITKYLKILFENMFQKMFLLKEK